MILLETAPNHPEHLALRLHMVTVVHAQPMPVGDATLSSVGARGHRVPAPTVKVLRQAPTAGSSDERACVQSFDRELYHRAFCGEVEGWRRACPNSRHWVFTSLSST